MADYARKLTNLKNRRLGIDPHASFAKSLSFSERAGLAESYEQRGKSVAIRYALGAMQELEPRYTQICHEQAGRVKNQLETNLLAENTSVSFELQGSVPLNIHIRFASDVDMLVIHNHFVTLDWNGPTSQTYNKLNSSVVQELLTLRKQCEQILESRFPAADVDKQGAKSISISGGSLERKIDVVPSCWHDNATFQASQLKQDREVQILDKDVLKLVANRPFLHIQKIEQKDAHTSGGAKKAIRFLKSLKNDADTKILLSSYEIAALVWHFERSALEKPFYMDLAIVAGIQQQLELVVGNELLAYSLDVPDGSRKIIDSKEKFIALKQLKKEVDETARDIANELNPNAFLGHDQIRKRLTEEYIF